MSFLLLASREAILIDAGTGVARLLEPQIFALLKPYDCLHIILSHYHLDHVIGLSYLPGVWTRGAVRIYAPTHPLVEAGPDEAFGKLFSPPLLPMRLADFPVQVEVVQAASQNLTIGDLPFRLRAQRHPGGSVGIRVADVLAYVTDTVVDGASAEFVQGVRLLLHEVWLTDSEAQTDEVERSRHSYSSGVARIAKQAAVHEVMPVHFHPKRSRADICSLADEIQALSGAEVTIPQEGQLYQLEPL